MRLIVVGCRGAGKSTFIRSFSERTGFEIIDYGNPIIVEHDESILENYIETRKEYIEYTTVKLDEFKNYDVIQARGPETLFSYSIYAPLLNGNIWNIEERLEVEFERLKTYYSDMVIMLDFPIEEIRRRCDGDEKKRSNMDFWSLLWYQYERSYFLKFNNLIYVENFSWSIDECVSYVKEKIGI